MDQRKTHHDVWSAPLKKWLPFRASPTKAWRWIGDIHDERKDVAHGIATKLAVKAFDGLMVRIDRDDMLGVPGGQVRKPAGVAA